MSELFWGLIIIAIGVYISFRAVNYIYREYVEINFTREEIYGWYDMHILCSASFSKNMTAEEIIEIKDRVAKELKEEIIKYNKVQKLS